MSVLWPPNGSYLLSCAEIPQVETLCLRIMSHSPIVVAIGYLSSSGSVTIAQTRFHGPIAEAMTLSVQDISFGCYHYTGAEGGDVLLVCDQNEWVYSEFDAGFLELCMTFRAHEGTLVKLKVSVGGVGDEGCDENDDGNGLSDAQRDQRAERALSTWDMMYSRYREYFIPSNGTVAEADVSCLQDYCGCEGAFGCDDDGNVLHFKENCPVRGW
ncbi:hypothetical protein HWV62_4924 [Athelia sp. TMB]|nr:hypothetical protein HWV62_4924 [Athelia sp. TMB]